MDDVASNVLGHFVTDWWTVLGNDFTDFEKKPTFPILPIFVIFQFWAMRFEPRAFCPPLLRNAPNYLREW